MTTATVNRYALNDFLTAYLSDLGWCANTEDDMEALNECVHTCADAVEKLMNAPDVDVLDSDAGTFDVRPGPPDVILPGHDGMFD